MDFRPELSWEFLSIDEIAAKTVRAVRNHVRHVKECSPFYKTHFEGIHPEDIQHPDDIARLPFTNRGDLHGNSSRFVAVAPERIVETVVTSGTAGNSLPVVFTRSDLDRIAFSSALSLHGMGLTPADRIQLLVSLDRCVIDGLLQYRGTMMLGANTMRTGSGAANISGIQKLLQFFKPSVLIGTPSFLHALGTDLAGMGHIEQKNGITTLVCTGESLRTRELEPGPVCRSLESLWGASVFSVYGAAELAVSCGECGERRGAHAPPELVYTEIVDECGKPLPDGEVGELVATPLGVEGMPLARYRTGDLTFKVPGPCSCGRNSGRIGPILGRTSQTFIYRGTRIYPLSLTNALDDIPEIKDYVIIIENDDGRTDAVTIHAATPPSALEAIARSIKVYTGEHIPVLVSNVPTIQSLRGGVKRRVPIIDRRGAAAAGKA